ncbi:hypothetical protein ACHAXT_001425 [Thalassiosira profunda]
MLLKGLEKEACEELQHSLHEMGVNRSDDEHVKFRKRAIKTCIADLSRMDKRIDFQALKKEAFPKTYGEAYAHVLRNDTVSGEQIYLYNDDLDVDGFPEPFCRWFDRRTGEVIAYQRKQEYQRFSSAQLDPFQRFGFNETTEEELFFERWFVDDDDAACDGVLFEAILACHAVQSVPCFNCKFKKALRWTGGGNSAWTDMICTNCRAVYEIKTKANMEKVENALKWNNIPGGSFSRWCSLRNSVEPGRKMYLVILPRKSTINRRREKGKFTLTSSGHCHSVSSLSHSFRTVFPVTIAEIDKVLPRVYPGSFNPNRQTIRFKSNVALKLATKAKWFDLPIPDEAVEVGQIAEKVFKERFSEETYDRLMHELVLGSESGDGSIAASEGDDEDANGTVSSIAEELAKLEMPDDWEDLASDSE